jgi:hypothetical protein
MFVNRDTTRKTVLWEGHPVRMGGKNLAQGNKNEIKH